MNKKQKRIKLINYFLKISQAQQQVQILQTKLISHIRFNPLIIYNSITTKHPTPKKIELIHFIQHIIKSKAQDFVKIYVNKHFHKENITLEEFSSSLLPYTPNILRDVAETIDKQMETKHLDRVIHQLYVNLVELEIKNIYEICLRQEELNLNWKQLKKFMKKDLLQNGKKMDLIDQSEFSVMTIRKWLQLWMQIHEYKILNVVRWFGGLQQQKVKKIYESTNIHIKCTCNHSHIPNQSSQNSKGLQQHSVFSKTFTLKKVKSTESLMTDPHQYLKIFIKYIQTIVNSQRKLQILNSRLKPYKRQVELILHEITNKKSNYTRATSLITQIEKGSKENTEIIQKLYLELDHTKFDNNLIFSLYGKQVSALKTNKKMLKEQIIQDVLSVLYNFCLSRATLKAIAKDLVFGVQHVFHQLDQSNKKYLDLTDLKLILKELNIKVKDYDLMILLNHFGDGQTITLLTLRNVMKIQGDN